MFNNIAIPIIVASVFDPPYDKNGSGMPVNGMRLMFAPMFINV